MKIGPISEGQLRFILGLISAPVLVGVNCHPMQCEFWALFMSLCSKCSCITSQYEANGRVADSMLVNTILMLVYVSKFFWWEDGYWNTMDIAHDRG